MRCTGVAKRRSPRHLTRASLLVREARQHEQEIGQSIQVAYDDFRNLHLSSEVHDTPLSAPTNRPCDVQSGSLRRATWNDEAAQLVQLSFTRIDGTFQFADALFVDARLCELLAHLLQLWCGEHRADAEEVALHRYQDFVDAR